MNLTSDRIRSIGWVSVLVVCFAGTVGLTLRVNAVKSQVHDTDKKIVWVKRDIDFLQTEFQTRSNQQALRDLNDLEFGYKAPTAPVHRRRAPAGRARRARWAGCAGADPLCQCRSAGWRFGRWFEG
ncbi:hypothetical protein ACFSLT_10625 [Novosphingobium resinovorum]